MPPTSARTSSTAKAAQREAAASTSTGKVISEPAGPAPASLSEARGSAGNPDRLDRERTISPQGFALPSLASLSQQQQASQLLESTTRPLHAVLHGTAPTRSPHPLESLLGGIGAWQREAIFQQQHRSFLEASSQHQLRLADLGLLNPNPASALRDLLVQEPLRQQPTAAALLMPPPLGFGSENPDQDAQNRALLELLLRERANNFNPNFSL